MLFVAELTPLTHISRKSTAGYQFSKSGEKVNHLLFMDDLMLYAKNVKSLDSYSNSSDFQQRRWNGVWNRKMCHGSVENRTGSYTNLKYPTSGPINHSALVVEKTERQSEEEEGKEKSEVVGEWTTNHLHGSSLQVFAAKCSRSFY